MNRARLGAGISGRKAGRHLPHHHAGHRDRRAEGGPGRDGRLGEDLGSGQEKPSQRQGESHWDDASEIAYPSGFANRPGLSGKATS